VTSLRSGVLSSGLGGPAIFNGPLTFSPSLTLSGLHFGNRKGRIYIRVSGLPASSIALGTFSTFSTFNTLSTLNSINTTTAPTSLSSPNIPDVEVSDQSITAWENSSIVLNITSKVMDELHKAIAQAKLSGIINYQFLIQTDTGEQSNWYSVLGPS
jgi:hypothetical protein